MSETIQPFHLSVPEAELAALRARLAGTRWPDRETVPDASQGPPLATIQALCAYWQDGYDWRRCEAVLNGFGQFRTTIDGLGIHFLHVRSPEADALPLLMTHGWPGSVLEFRHVIGRLTDPVAHGGSAGDAFHLVIPSLPGFGFSDRPAETGWGVARVADAWIELMGRLGYERWGAQGGDWGSAVTEAIGRKAPAGCVGLHFNFPQAFPTPQEMADATPQEQAMIASAMHYQEMLSGYSKEQSTRPQTIGYALSDSPVGLAAWIYTLFQDVSDTDGRPEATLGMDAILDDVMLYWLPNTAASSARLYWEAAQAGAGGQSPGGPNPTPAGFSVFPGEMIRASRRWLEKRYTTILHFNELERGGHFAAMEQPVVFADEVRSTFRSVR
ncbi:MAG: Epoxide hydrolase [uncultured Thermomicrobiales bacterium]|uniref:Epoxide hydrolase n=1 Tax=uncultured Thermomicrobiales bacterium TaxID=1645740 RepID=A0A6J4UKA4_9BACT|nr:MAG: Epoxide hydrolase [uncultured Thermomicrobiales bacterium]